MASWMDYNAIKHLVEREKLYGDALLYERIERSLCMNELRDCQSDNVISFNDLSHFNKHFYKLCWN